MLFKGLFERKIYRERGKEGEKDKPAVLWLTPKMATAARAESGQAKNPEGFFFFGGVFHMVTGAQGSDSSSVAFPDVLIGSQMQSRKAGNQTAIQMKFWCHRWQRNAV